MFTTLKLALLSSVVFAASVKAICSGYDLGIGNQIPNALGNGVSEWKVYDDSCNVVDSLITNENPCDQGIFGCSPAPIYFDQYTSTTTGITYTCGRDSVSESCDGNSISVCCED